MDIEHIKIFFEKEVPKLGFHLKAAPAVVVDISTINAAKKLAANFSDFTHPDVLPFLDLIATSGRDDLDESILAILDSKAYTRFCFYLTVLTGRLGLMLEMHAVQYLPTIGIPLNTIVSIEYYPSMDDRITSSNKHGMILNGDTNKMLAYCHTMQDSYIRANLITDYEDISAIDVLGYVTGLEVA